MKLNFYIYLPLCLLFFYNNSIFSQTTFVKGTVSYVIDTLSLTSNNAQIEKLKYKNELLRYENYKKSYLPSISFALSPIGFNRSLRLMQDPTTGSYTYVKDYSNSSSVGLTIHQKVPFTGGQLQVGSSLSYLNEFSYHRKSYSTSPYYISYSQNLWGGRRRYLLEKKIEESKNVIAINKFCSNIAQIQQNVLSQYMDVLAAKMKLNLSKQTVLNNDTLLDIARIKLDNGRITEYDYKQIELQSLRSKLDSEDAIQNYQQLYHQLLTSIGTTQEIAIVSPEFDLPLSIDSVAIWHYVRKNNSFYQQQELEKLEAEQNLYLVKLENRFNASISLGYGTNQYAEHLVEAYHHPNTRQSIQVGIQIPIFQWGINKNKVKMAENIFQSNLLERETRKRNFENQIAERINAYRSAVKLWMTAKRTYELSQEQYKLALKKFSLGRISDYELYAAQNNQFTSLSQYASAIRQAYTNYYIIRGMTLYDFKKERDLIESLVK